ncbi:hypothetical protein C3747_128g11 [Trypanosoma cruzi]|uniref:Inward rectifier potassium channel C-terminal domain-containing protein n=2 Tax=Trypanosoma cruzi TaxID=5693 RepID=Q4DL62_TRYCC|nr:hypothetical protein, conserved [Trypanosoma cruzi]EAN93250.1 hypothetical protein, conserved [Trypanosoma cruzi]PWV05552.1 hypothetical protein C3747_128g11 [Trypanosoma cruzi]RNC46027.1 hypothetical protein TcCL_NonESM04139 [Trypanosoma cruzi]|eukprot:XP_815101.1 hypothetical protein [Trypanosoma cruzi strain CL Brener]
MRVSEDKRLRGQSLVPGQRNVHLEPGLTVSSLFDTHSGHKEKVVRVFDEKGCLTTREVGVKRFQFARLSIFYMIRSLTWPVLCTYLLLLYIAILFAFAMVYFIWGNVCGAWEDAKWVTALYFTIVSLAANGGYFGEPTDTMLQPDHTCFTGRTVLVMLLSYTNIIFVGIVAALVVGKAEYGGRLSQRIVFSDFCSLTSVPGRRDRCWRLTFRMANSDKQKPIAHGRLRLFIVTAESLKDRRMSRGEMRRQSLAELPEEQRSSKGGGKSWRQRLPHEMSIVSMEQEEGGIQLLRASASSLMEDLSPADTSLAVTQGQLSPKSPRGRQRRGKRRRHEEQKPPGTKCELATGRGKEGDEDHAAQTKKTCIGSAPTCGSTIAVAISEQGRGISDPSPFAEAGIEAAQHQRHQERLPLKHPASSHPTSSFAAAAAAGVFAAGGNHEDGFERVSIHVEELRWTSSNEQYLEARQGQLSLWFPVSITHFIDRRSPLFRYVDQEKMDPAMLLSQSLSSASPTLKTTGEKGNTIGSLRSFQIVATFDATEMESGATIVAKRTYTLNDIITHYRFSNKMVQMRPGSNEVLIDYHYFNEMIPVSGMEPTYTSTSESDTTL